MAYRISDEKQNAYESSLAAEEEAKAAVEAAEADLAKAIAAVVTAKAEVATSRADLRVLEAVETRAEILVQYLKLISPYHGVLTHRYYHRGDFISSAR